MERKTLGKSLQQLDLSANEAEVYLNLLELGPSNAGPIIRQTGLHRQFVYSALDRLKERGLASFVIQDGRRVFEAAPARALVELQRQRETLAESLIPQLDALSLKGSDRLTVFTRRGQKEFHQNLITVLEQAAASDKIVRTIGGGSADKFYELLGGFYDVYLNAAKRLRVRKHLLAPEQLSEPFKNIFARERGTELRLSPYLSSPTYTRITDELVTIEVYATEPMIIQIWNSSIAQSYKEHFEMLWQKARSYTVPTGG